jgi:hypothetical protein
MMTKLIPWGLGGLLLVGMTTWPLPAAAKPKSVKARVSEVERRLATMDQRLTSGEQQIATLTTRPVLSPSNVLVALLERVDSSVPGDPTTMRVRAGSPGTTVEKIEPYWAELYAVRFPGRDITRCAVVATPDSSGKSVGADVPARWIPAFQDAVDAVHVQTSFGGHMDTPYFLSLVVLCPD